MDREALPHLVGCPGPVTRRSMGQAASRQHQTVVGYAPRTRVHVPDFCMGVADVLPTAPFATVSVNSNTVPTRPRARRPAPTKSTRAARKSRHILRSRTRLDCLSSCSRSRHSSRLRRTVCIRLHLPYGRLFAPCAEWLRGCREPEAATTTASTPGQ